MSEYNAKVYRKQGGDELVVADGGAITVESGGSLTVAGVTVDETTLAMNDLTATAEELNAQADGRVAAVTAAAAAGASNVTEVTITFKDGAGAAVAEVHNFDLWLSDDADGAGLTGTSASGNVEPKSASGIVLQTYSAKKAFHAQSLKTGVFVLSITDSSKTAFKVCVQNPANGKTVVVKTLASGDYGA